MVNQVSIDMTQVSIDITKERHVPLPLVAGKFQKGLKSYKRVMGVFMLMITAVQKGEVGLVSQMRGHLQRLKVIVQVSDNHFLKIAQITTRFHCQKKICQAIF